jgi:hypothetical protein
VESSRISKDLRFLPFSFRVEPKGTKKNQIRQEMGEKWGKQRFISPLFMIAHKIEPYNFSAKQATFEKKWHFYR